MAIVLFDSNILIDHTLGYHQATAELAAYDNAIISAMTWIEATCKLPKHIRAELDVQLLIIGIRVVHTNDLIMRRASELRGLTSKKLPDCIIRATAEVDGRIIVTRNPVDFGGAGNSKLHVPYDLTDGLVSNVRPPAV